MERGDSTSILDRSVRRKATVERICDLPDSILSHILSFLPTKNAVATHILSQRWKFMWTTTTNLDFHCTKYSFECNAQFVKFVTYVLLLRKAAGYLNRFSLTWFGGSPFQVNTWLGIVIAKNLQELCVRVSTCSLPIQVLRSVFSCEALRSLELDSECCISPEIVVSLPRLESLKLTSIYFQSKDDFRKLVSGCPVLKYLYIDMDIERMFKRLNLDLDDGAIFEYEISSTFLRHLEIYARGRDLQHTVLTNVHLDAPSLECVKLHGQISTILVLRTCTSLVEADIQLAYSGSKCEEENYCNSMVEAVCALGYARTLTLSAQVTRALGCATTKMRTTFSKLTRLDVKIVSRHLSSVQDFIELSDNLEVLTIQKDDVLASDVALASIWKNPKAIPRCLSNSLKTVSMDGYDDICDELEMIGYILKYGCVLEVLKIRFGDRFDQDSIWSHYSTNYKLKFMALQKILKFPRKSPVCEVELR